jgi:hydrogenase maturation protease
MKRLKPPIPDFRQASDFKLHNPASAAKKIFGQNCPRILIAGIGNIFMGDDGFGCEVARALLARGLPPAVKVQDFGIRSFDLAYALTEGYEAIILVDAVSQRASPGTVFLIEPEVGGFEAGVSSADAHTMNPVAVIQMAERLGGIKGKLFLVGCEPRILDSEDGEMELSDEVRRGVPRALEMIGRLVNELLEKEATNAGAMPV